MAEFIGGEAKKRAEFIGGGATTLERQSGGEVPVLRKANQPKYPQYRLKEDREGTFKSWTSPLSSDKLVSAGFFSIGKGDKTCCFYCGKTFCNWAEHDDPLKEHASYSDCAFLRETFGEKKIKRDSRISQEFEKEDFESMGEKERVDKAGGKDHLIRDAEVCIEEIETPEEMKRRYERLVTSLRSELERTSAEKAELAKIFLLQSETFRRYKASADAERMRARDAVTKSEEYKLKNTVLKASCRNRVHEENAPTASQETGVSRRQFGDIAKWISHLSENDVKVKAQLEVCMEDFEEERRARILAEDRCAAAQQMEAETQQVNQSTDQEINRQVAEQAMKQIGYSNKQIANAGATFADKHGHSDYRGEDLAMIVENPDPPLSNEAGAGWVELSSGQQMDEGADGIPEEVSPGQQMNDIAGGLTDEVPSSLQIDDEA